MAGLSATAWAAACANWLDGPTTKLENVYFGFRLCSFVFGLGGSAAAGFSMAGSSSSSASCPDSETACPPPLAILNESSTSSFSSTSLSVFVRSSKKCSSSHSLKKRFGTSRTTESPLMECILTGLIHVSKF